MRIALAQIDTTVGDVRGNGALVVQSYRRARAAGAELVVFPELTLAGYPPRDLLERTGFVAACERQLAELQTITSDGGGLLVGTLSAVADSEVGRRVYNSAALLADGELVCRVHKSLLPSYDVFDEARYFHPGPRESVTPISFRGRSLGITICEDVWNDADFWQQRLYDFDPAQRLVDHRTDRLQVAARGQLGHDAAEQRVLVDLGAHDVGEQPVAGTENSCIEPFGSQSVTTVGADGKNVVSVEVTNVVGPPGTPCDELYRTYEKNINLGSGFESGSEWDV